MLCAHKCEGCMMKCNDKEANDGVVLEAGYIKRGRVVDQHKFEHEKVM